MIYVMSDIHGCYNEYIKMLELIDFNSNDTLYIIGDVCDRGKDSIKVLFHMMDNDNIIPIFGNHDVDSLINLEKVLNDEDYSYDRDFRYWLSDGGKETLEEFMSLSIKDKNKVLEYLSDFRYYEEINVNNINYLLIHGGLKDFDENKSLDEYRLLDIVSDRIDYDRVYYKDKIIITGHTITTYIDRSMTGKIIKMNNHIAIDCGCVFGYGLGCLCLDTMEEYYIK